MGCGASTQILAPAAAPSGARQAAVIAGGERIVLVLGGPGSGTEEQCSRLAAKFGCAHLCIEALVRSAVREDTETGRTISELIHGGKIVPATVYLSLLSSAIARGPKSGASAPCYIVDGFPKSRDNLALLEEQLGACTRALLLDASDAQLEAKLLATADDGDEAALPPEAVQRRIRTFRNQTLPCIQALEQRGVLSRVDASGPPDDTFAALAAAYEKLGL